MINRHHISAPKFHIVIKVKQNLSVEDFLIPVSKRIAYLRLAALSFWYFSFFSGNAQPYYNRQENFIKANSVWAFGEGAGLNFNSGIAVATTTAISTVAASAAAASPTTGQLLFYTNGME